MIIEVTEDDIRNGGVGTSNRCPIALAVKRATGRDDASVECDTLSIGGLHLDLPPSAQTFVDFFDSGLYVSPFKFELDIEI